MQKLVSLEKDLVLKEQHTKTEPFQHEYYTCEDNYFHFCRNMAS